VSFLRILAEFGDTSAVRRTAVHSGNMGDILYSLPTIAALGVDRLLLNLVDDPGVGGRRFDRRSADFLTPLLLAQPSIRSVAIVEAPAELAVRFGLREGDKLVSRGLPLEQVDAGALGVDHCLDRFRLMPIDEMHLVDAHARAMNLRVDGRRPFLSVEPAREARSGESILLSLTPRYRHLPATFFAELLDGLGPVRLIGRPEEQHVYQGIAGEFVTATDAIELARLIAAARLFIGTPSLPYAVAEGLKVRRVVDVPSWPLNAFPLGLDGWILPSDLGTARELVAQLLDGGRRPIFSVARPSEARRPAALDRATPLLEAQIAWRSGETFSAAEAQLQGVALDRSRQVVRLEVPKLPPTVRALGLGLTGYNGWLGVGTMHLHEAGGRILWCADAADLLRADIDVPAITLQPSDDPAEVLWDQFDPGAHVVLPIPRDRLPALAVGGALTFTLRTLPAQGWPALYRTLKAKVNDLAREREGHAREMAAASAAAQVATRNVERLTKNVERLTKIVRELEEGSRHATLHYQQQLQALLTSSSWRATAPLRAAVRALSKITASARELARKILTERQPKAADPVPAARLSRQAPEGPALDVPDPPATGAPVPAADVLIPSAEENPKDVWARQCVVELEALLASRERLDFRIAASPRVAIVLVLYNQAHFTLSCLRSIQAHGGVPSELVVVDNASSDETRQLLDRIDGATILTNDRNEGFLRAVNQAAQVTKAPYLLLLNNDARLRPGALSHALYRLQDESGIGAVGGQIVLLDGTLQEAGSIIWSDGSCLGYGRGEPPNSPEFMFTRDVDYVSGAFLLTRSALFRQLGGFDTAFAPAYYEETDYCMRLRAAGHRIVYDPRVQIQHYEFGSTAHPGEALALQQEHQVVFRRRHQAVLAKAHLPPGPGNVLFARARPSGRACVLVIDDGIPDPSRGAGHPRAAAIVRMIEAEGHFITHYPLRVSDEDWKEVHRVLPPTIEVMAGWGLAKLAAFLRARKGYYAAIVISRPHNMAFVRELLETEPDLLGDSRVIYDAEAVFALREQLRAETLGQTWSATEAAERIGHELMLARRADAVLAVSKQEAKQFSAHGHGDVRVLGHIVEARPTPAALDERRGILFVGRLEEDGSPNVDSVLWFVDQVLPEIAHRLGWTPPLSLAGRCGASSLQRLTQNPAVRFVGLQDDLVPLYASARLFIAPSRFASGIPHKIHEAAAHGVPCVVTPVLAGQLDWRNGAELLVGGDATDFAEACIQLLRNDRLWQEIRDRALLRLAADCSEKSFRSTLTAALALPGPTTLAGEAALLHRSIASRGPESAL